MPDNTEKEKLENLYMNSKSSLISRTLTEHSNS